MRPAIIVIASVVALTSNVPILANAADNPDITGRWRVMDADMKTKRAVIEVTRQSNDIVGTIIELVVQAGDDPEPLCTQCDGANHNRKIRGLVVLVLGPAETNGQYHGTILDPEEGNVYRCVVTPKDAGNRLVLRGYLLLPLLGRSETWIRER
jgi:uncharacterized protein (DUF2147 family)